MIDSLNGWATGDSYLLRTTDGGLTWYNFTPPGVSTFSGAFFKDSNAAWVLTALSPMLDLVRSTARQTAASPGYITMFRSTMAASNFWIILMDL